jgi:hypothetical protein
MSSNAPALIAAVASLIVSVISVGLSYVTRRRADAKLARLTAELSEQGVRRKAELDYLYEARKRLYTEFQPLLFQLAEACESAYHRIHGLAHAARNGHLVAGDERNWFNDPYYMHSTMHRLMAPMVIYRICQGRLTFVDLRVDAHLENQYRLAKALHHTWNDVFDLAQVEPACPYRNDDADATQREQAEPSVYARQHILMGQVDQILEAMTVVDKDGTPRCLSFAEFQEQYLNDTSRLRRYASVLEELFRGFHPASRPVLWRTLVAQAFLHQAIIRSLSLGDVVPPGNAIPADDERLFDWRSEADFAEGISTQTAIETPLNAARRHFASKPAPLSMKPPSQQAISA